MTALDDEACDPTEAAPYKSKSNEIVDQLPAEEFLSALSLKINELESSNDKLKTENLVLRTRYEALKSRKSLERRALVILAASIWLLFTFSVISRLLMTAGLRY